MARGSAYAVIDVGSTKIATIVGDLSERDALRVLGVGVAPSDGIEKGQISNITKGKGLPARRLQKSKLGIGIFIARQLHHRRYRIRFRR